MSTFEPVEEIAIAAEKGFTLFAEKERGDFVSYTDIEATIGLPYAYGPGSRWQVVMNKVRKRLREECGIVLEVVVAEGFKIPSASKQLLYCGEKRSKKIRNQKRYALKEIEATPDEELNNHERHHKHWMSDALRKEEKAEAERLRQIKNIKPTETIPQRPI